MSLRSGNTKRTKTKNIKGEEVAVEIRWSYGIEPSNFPPLLNIFLASRAVYSETWPIFYQENAFSFAMPIHPNGALASHWEARNCLRFLYDRPYHVLQHIRELHLHIGNAPQNPIRFKLTSGYWQILLDEISRYMSVRVLVLYLRGRIDHPDGYHLPDMRWKDWLFKITGLEELHLEIIGFNTSEEIIAFVKEMRSRMVVGGEHIGTGNFVLGQRSVPGVEWTIKKPGNSLLTSPNIVDMYKRDWNWLYGHQRAWIQLLSLAISWGFGPICGSWRTESELHMGRREESCSDSVRNRFQWRALRWRWPTQTEYQGSFSRCVGLVLSFHFKYNTMVHISGIPYMRPMVLWCSTLSVGIYAQMSQMPQFICAQETAETVHWLPSWTQEANPKCACILGVSHV